MRKKELVCAINNKLREVNARKSVSIPKQRFTIYDTDGNSADFDIKQRDKMVIFTKEDVAYFVDAAMDVIEEALKNGDDITINGFGSLRLHKRAARRTIAPATGEWCNVEERLVPKFFYGSRLRYAARAYELIRDEQKDYHKLPDPVYDEYDTEDED